MNDLVIKKAVSAYVAAYRWVTREGKDEDDRGRNFTGPTADDIITGVAGTDRALYRAYETAVVERARKRIGYQLVRDRGDRKWRQLDDREVAYIVRLRRGGAKYREIAAVTRRSHETIGRVLADAGLVSRRRA